jgi:hypothetical protein
MGSNPSGGMMSVCVYSVFVLRVEGSLATDCVQDKEIEECVKSQQKGCSEMFFSLPPIVLLLEQLILMMIINKYNFFFLQIYNLLYKLSNKQICYKETLVRSNHPMMLLLCTLYATLLPLSGPLSQRAIAFLVCV